MGLIFILFPVAEIYVFMKVGDQYGYFNAFMALVVSFIVGLLVVQSQGRAFLMRAQGDLMRGQLPANAVVQSALVFVGGLLLMVPGFLSDALGVLCIIPGTRHLIGLWARRAFKNQLAKGRVRFFGAGGATGGGFGGAGFGGFSSGFGRPPFETGERDVTPKIIDVTPNKSDDDRPNKP
jgi:UPF0716 protein FxsA